MVRPWLMQSQEISGKKTKKQKKNLKIKALMNELVATSTV